MFKSIRLSNAIRADIIQSMSVAWEKKQPKPHDLKKLENKIADAIWNKHYGKLPLKGIPNKMLKFSSEVQIQIDGSVRSFSMSESRPYEYHSEYTKSILDVIDQPTSAIQAYYDAKQQVSNWEMDRKAFVEEITLIMDSVSTSAQLIQLWPEAEQYLPPFAADPSKGINLPALKTSRLNEMLGIK